MGSATKFHTDYLHSLDDAKFSIQVCWQSSKTVTPHILHTNYSHTYSKFISHCTRFCVLFIEIAFNSVMNVCLGCLKTACVSLSYPAGERQLHKLKKS